MKAVRLGDAIPDLSEGIAPRPEAAAGELLIQVRAAGVTPSELLWYPTTHTRSGEVRRNAIPGHEFSGVIAGANETNHGFEAGQEVFGMNDWFAEGAMAEYCTAPETAVVPKPAGISHVEAGSVPISALTAWQGLFDRVRIQAGERILIHGGAGSVGCLAVQLAHLHGAQVIATASRANAELVRELGAGQVIDYEAAPFEQYAAGMDAVFDTVGGETLRRSWSVLKPTGRLVTIAAGGDGAADARSKEAFLLVQPDRRQLGDIADLLQAGRLRAGVAAVVPLSRAPDAYGNRVPKLRPGKVVVTISENSKGEPA